MKKLLLLLALLPIMLFSQDVMEPVTFRLDLNDVIENVPNSDLVQVFIQTSVANWVDIPMEDVGGNGIWRKNIFISHPEDENIDVFYRFKVTSFGNNGLPYTLWEGGTNADPTCLFNPNTQGLAQGDIRKIVFPQELIDNGTYVNPTGEYKLTHCFNECVNGPCEIIYDSWVNVQLLTDNFPSETSWNITPPGGSPIIIQNDSNMLSSTLYDTIVQLSGTIIASIYDNFGDGLGGSQWSGDDGWFMISNACQDTLMYVAGDFGDTLIDTLTVAPCAPPTEGCTDPFALNYDSTSYISNNELCEYPPCTGLDSFTVDQTCLPTGQILVQYFWSLDQTNVNCTPSKFWYWNENGAGPFQYGLNPEALDFAVFAGNGQMPPNWSVEHYGVVEFADGSFSDTIAYTPVPCISGCTDPTQPTYNPWATFDDGSCSGTNCDQATTYQITMEITFDNWPGETGWTMNSGGVIGQELPGAYNFNDIGQTYTYTFCIDQNSGFELIVTDTYGDGMAGTTSGGSMDGMIVIYDCLGDTKWYMDNPGFGDVLYSGQQFGVPCELEEPIPGCTDDDYQEYNPLATVNDSSCVNLHVYGCTDNSAFNFDPNATINDIVPDCQYQLWIGDAGGDGWGNSYIGVYQNGVNYGTFTMGPGSYQDSFPLILDAGIPVQIYYFEVGGPQQPPEEIQFQTWHNSFKLTNADGVILIHEGQNPFANNGQGALQSFEAPFWVTYSDIPYCGDYCIPKVVGCTDPTAFNYNPEANVNVGCVPVVLGCTNELAFNFNPLANTDDGSCEPVIIGCMDETAFNYNEEANENDEASCIPVIEGCMDDGKFNYNPAANTDDGSCIPFIYGCTDINAFNFDPNANTDIGNCIPVVLGCTDPEAFNYNVNANTDDESCIPEVLGCTDPTALNFNELANINTGCIYPVLGCTDPSAFNFDMNANTDDGSCVDVVIGCTDPTALNYNVFANTNNGCIYPVLGCTDADAFNYDPLANTNDGSCVDFIYGCTDPTQFNYDINANTDNGSCIPYIYGCTDSTAFNYNISANTDNGSCISVVLGCIDSQALNYDVDANTDDGSCIPFLYGCTDSNALNYNALANTDDGSCIPVLLGCTDVDALNYNALANTDDGSCIDVVEGCMDAIAFNFNPLANVDDGSCIAVVLGCTDLLAFNYNSNANTDDGSCIPVILGCTDATAFNYNTNANTDNGSCVPVVFGCMDVDAFNYDPLANIDNGTCLGVVLGCINPTAINFDPLANTDDGSCINPVYGCTDSTMFNYNPLANTDNGTCIPFAYGCTNANALNYDPLANTDDGSCVLPIYGCTDSTMFNYNPLANVDNGSCLPFVYGCTDPLAYNYNPLANTTDNSCCLIAGCTDSLAVNYNEFACFDDNSCITAVPGCTDVAAYNYNPAANVTDSTACLYDAGCYGGPGIPYWLNDGCYAWVIDVDEYCCTNDWDATCQSMYDYCQLGWPTSIPDVSALGIVVYPNPTKDVLTIETRLDIQIEVHDLMGKLLIKTKNVNRLDLSGLSNGLYNLSIIHEEKRYNKQIIKQ